MKEIIKSTLITCAIVGTIVILSLIAHYLSFKFPETFTNIIQYVVVILAFLMLVFFIHTGRTIDKR